MSKQQKFTKKQKKQPLPQDGPKYNTAFQINEQPDVENTPGRTAARSKSSLARVAPYSVTATRHRNPLILLAISENRMKGTRIRLTCSAETFSRGRDRGHGHHAP